MARCALLPQHPPNLHAQAFCDAVVKLQLNVVSLHLAKSAAQMNMGVWCVMQSLCSAL